MNVDSLICDICQDYVFISNVIEVRKCTMKIVDRRVLNERV